MLDCGLPFKKLEKLLEFKLPDAVLVTHEHKDHAKAVKDFIKHGVDVYMTKGTADALQLEENHRLNLIVDGESWLIGEVMAYAFRVVHDAKDPVNFLINDGEDEVVYYTDLGRIPHKKFVIPTKILIETNFSEDELKKTSLDEKQKKRIFENHLSVGKALKILSQSQFSELKEVYLIHVSKRHGDAEKFKLKMQNFLKELGHENIKVFVTE